MSTALIELGYQKPKQKKFHVTVREVCLTIAWASLVLMVGLSIASSIQSTSGLAFDNSIAQGL